MPAAQASPSSDSYQHQPEPLDLMRWIPARIRGYESPEHLAPVVELFARVAAGEPVRALVSTPPRHAKTETLIAGIAWLLEQQPQRTSAYVSYGQRQANSKSRKIRRLAQEVGIELADDMANLAEWRTTAGGGLLSTGIGGPLTGQGVDGCFVAGTMVETKHGPIDIATLAEDRHAPMVLAFDHERGTLRYCVIEAGRRLVADELVEVVTERGSTKCTPEHPFFVIGEGYKRADSLARGDWLLTPHGYVRVIEARRLPGRGVPVYDLQVEGCHNFFADGVLVHNCLIIDDPIKNRADAESSLKREQQEEWFRDVAYTRLEGDAACIIVATRWHEDDLIGRVEQYDDPRWEVVNLQAIAEEGDLRREPGTALWPRKFGVEKLAKIRATVGEYTWASLYQGRPRPKGDRLFSDPTCYESLVLDGCRLVIGVDPAATEDTKADYSVAVVLAVWGRGEEMRADVVEVRRWQLEIPAVCEELERLQRRYMGAPLVVEAVGGFKAVPQTLRRINPRLKVVECKPSADKFVRAQPVAAAWKAGRVRTPVAAAWLPDFVHELGAFTGVKDAHDDQVDALAHAWSYAEQMPVAVKSRAVSSGERRAMDGW